jgi:hypothetical protein
MSEEPKIPFREWMTKNVTIIGRGRRLVICTKCGEQGSLILGPTKTNDKSYKYYYVVHSVGRKKKKHYMGKFENLPEQYKKILEANP